jgi:hypothetical protein
MASIFEKEPIFSHERPWNDTTKLPEKYKFSGRAGKAEVHLDSGSLGMEFFYEKTLPDFIQAATRLDWDWYETFSQFENVLEGSYKTAWREVLKDHFSDETIVEKDEEGFHRAVRLFVCTILDCEMPRDVQYVYLAPGGDHQIRKDLLTAPRDHARRFKEMLRIAELLPPGETPPPSEKLAVQWYYMTYHRADRAEYVKSGKKLSDETIETLSAYFQSLFAQRKIDGTLERHEIERLRNRAKRTLANDLREKREARRSSHARREARERERGRRDRSRPHRRGGDDRRPTSYDRSGRDGRDRYNNQPKRGGRDGGVDRGKQHEGDDRGTAPKKGSWTKSHDNKNRRDDRDRRDDRERRTKADAHHVDSRYTSSDDDTKLDDEHTDVDDDDDASKDTANSGAYEGFAVFESPYKLEAQAKLAAQAKRGSAVANKEVAVARKRKPDAATVSPQDKRTKPSRKVVESDLDEENDDDENFLASCGKALDRDPLDI